MIHATQPHYIRENKAARVPRRVIVLDVQTRSEYADGGETQLWRCASATFIHWTNAGRMIYEQRSYTSADTLWSDIGDFTRPRQRTILYAHNLPVKLRVSQGLRHLPRQGWKLEAIRVANQGAWARWSRLSASITLVDSASIFPVTVYTLGQFLALSRYPLPEGDNINEWLNRSDRDCEIVARTIGQYVQWLRTGAAGNWQLTGAGQSWAHWRHRHYSHHILCHGDSTAISAERRAMFTGRAENWVWGRDLRAPVYEWDFTNAYPSIVRDSAIPVRLTATTGPMRSGELAALMRRYIVLADVEVTTGKPVVPARHNDRILWPVGTFETTLWQPELEALTAAGGTYRVLRAWLYRSAPALSSWATWVLGELHSIEDPAHKWRAVLLKHWSRALIGRFATQYQNWELLGWDPHENVRAGRMHNNDTGESTEFMQVGHEIHVMTGTSESDDSCPQITSFIMSVARSKLWTAIGIAGATNVLYMDTDSLVVNMTGNSRLRSATQQGQLDGLRLKGRHSGFEIYGPRAAIIGGQEKLAGVPRNPFRTGDTTWEGEVWTQFERALRTGEWDRVTVAKRRFSVKWNEHRRARNEDGTTVPYSLPGYRPAQPVGHPQPVTDKERADHIRRALGAKATAGSAGDRVGGSGDIGGDSGRAVIVAAALGRTSPTPVRVTP